MIYLTSLILNAAFGILLFWQTGAGDKLPSDPPGTGANETGSSLIFILAVIGLTLLVIFVVALPFLMIYRKNVRPREESGELRTGTRQ